MKLGTNDITLKVGSVNVDAAYLGTVLVYSGSTTPTIQWVTFNNGDTISSDLDIYGIKGTASDLGVVFSLGQTDDIFIENAGRNKYNAVIGDYLSPCYTENSIPSSETIEYIFSNIGCSNSYTVSNRTVSNTTNGIQLYIYA